MFWLKWWRSFAAVRHFCNVTYSDSNNFTGPGPAENPRTGGPPERISGSPGVLDAPAKRFLGLPGLLDVLAGLRKRAQSGQTGGQMAPREPSPKRPHRLPRRPKTTQRGPPRGSQNAKNSNCHVVFVRFWDPRFVGLPGVRDGARGAENRPTTGQKSFQKSPESPKTARRWPQDIPKRAP